MIEKDTVRLLRECDAGVKMGVSAIDDCLPYTSSDGLRKALQSSRNEHLKLDGRLQKELADYNDEGKEPNKMAQGMSWLKTNAKLMVNESDGTVADLITDGCNMGVKSLGKYLNQYKAADEKSKNIAKELMGIEEKLAMQIREYL